MGPSVSAILCVHILEDLGLETQNPSVMVRDQFGETSFGVTLQAQPKNAQNCQGERPKCMDWWLCLFTVMGMSKKTGDPMAPEIQIHGV